jgi:hypothetical protein
MRRSKYLLYSSLYAFRVLLQKEYSSSCNMQWRNKGGVEVQFHAFFNLHTRRDWVVNFTPRPIYPQETPGTHYTWGWMSSRTIWTVRKILPSPGFEPRIFQPFESRYTGWRPTNNQPSNSQLQCKIWTKWKCCTLTTMWQAKIGGVRRKLNKVQRKLSAVVTGQ